MLRYAVFLNIILAVTYAYEEPYSTTSTEDPPPHPYAFSYNAGRYPGHVDREHTEVSDGSGTVKGRYSYLDPRHHVHTVDYTADKDGFHPTLNDAPPEHPSDSNAVADAKLKHLLLYAQIAREHAEHPHPDIADNSVPHQTAAVAAAAEKHMALFRVIAEQHARIAAERAALQREEELKHPHPPGYKPDGQNYDDGQWHNNDGDGQTDNNVGYNSGGYVNGNNNESPIHQTGTQGYSAPGQGSSNVELGYNPVGYGQNDNAGEHGYNPVGYGQNDNAGEHGYNAVSQG